GLNVGSGRSLDSLFPIDPDFKVRASLGCQVPGDGVGRGLQSVVNAVVVMRSRAAHDVPLDIATGSQRGQECRVDLVNGGPQVALDHAVQLKALTRGDAQGAAAQPVAQA